LEKSKDFVSSQALAAYRSGPQVAANIVIGLNFVGAQLLGLVVIYECSFHGRAAGK
jgi:putative Mg2+ transporter-C (MgtC) family protein